MRMYRKYVKRGLDILFALILLILLSPLMLLISVAVLCLSGRPVFFLQERLGRNTEIFRMIKFRSMEVGSEYSGSGVYSDRNDPRLTGIGRFLRMTSLDELPQLINILKGDMSFVGPRPPLTYHPWPVEKYTEEQLRMFEVRPGLTGWAQVHGRRQVEWNRRISLNIWYVDHMSFLLDLRILMMTVAELFRPDNENHAPTVL